MLQPGVRQLLTALPAARVAIGARSDADEPCWLAQPTSLPHCELALPETRLVSFQGLSCELSSAVAATGILSRSPSHKRRSGTPEGPGTRQSSAPRALLRALATGMHACAASQVGLSEPLCSALGTQVMQCWGSEGALACAKADELFRSWALLPGRSGCIAVLTHLPAHILGFWGCCRREGCYP